MAVNQTPLAVNSSIDMSDSNRHRRRWSAVHDDSPTSKPTVEARSPLLKETMSCGTNAPLLKRLPTQRNVSVSRA